MSEASLIEMVVSGGSGVGVAIIVYIKLRDIAESMKKLSDAFIRMEERGDRIQRATPAGAYQRANTEG